MSIKPLGDRIFIKRVEQAQKTAGGLLIPETSQEKAMEGIVAVVGVGSLDENGNRNTFHVKEGDRVVFGKWAGDEVEIEGEEYVVMTEENIIGVLK